VLNQLIEKIERLLLDLNHFYLDQVVNTREKKKKKVYLKIKLKIFTSWDSGGEPLIDVDGSNFNV
jgi:hypothetical protein